MEEALGGMVATMADSFAVAREVPPSSTSLHRALSFFLSLSLCPSMLRLL
jgi:hypothetical protein